MKKSFTLPLTAALLLSAGLAAPTFAAPADAPNAPATRMEKPSKQDKAGPMRGLQRLHDDLKLDAAQEALWQNAAKAGQDARQDRRDRMRAHHDEMRKLLDAPNADLRAIAKRMEDFRAEQQKQHQEMTERWLKVYDALNPEQKEKARQFLKTRFNRMDSRTGGPERQGKGRGRS